MNLSNDMFNTLLAFLDIDSIARLAQTCKTYNNLCKKHTLYSRLLLMNIDRKKIITQINDNYLDLNDKYAIIYNAMLSNNYDVINYYKNKQSLSRFVINWIICSLCNILSVEQFDMIAKIFNIRTYYTYIITNNGSSYDINETRSIAYLCNAEGNLMLYDRICCGIIENNMKN